MSAYHTYCSWASPDPQSNNENLLDFLGWSDQTRVPFTDKNSGDPYKTYIPPDTTDFSDSKYKTLMRIEAMDRVGDFRSLANVMTRLGLRNGRFSPDRTHFLDFVAKFTDCRFRTFIPIQFSKNCRVKKVFMDDQGNVKEVCGENMEDDSSTDDVVSPLALLSETYYIELLFDHADNKRRNYRGQLHPSFWTNPPKEEIEEAFSRGWVALPNDVTLKPNRRDDSLTLLNIKDRDISKHDYVGMMSDLCCSADAIMVRADQRRVYGSKDNVDKCTKFFFKLGSDKSELQVKSDRVCNPCTRTEASGACVTKNKNSKQLEMWWKKRKDPCWELCDKLMDIWGDIIGQKWCAERCRKALGVKPIETYDKDMELNAKMRVWIRPDERIFSSIETGESNSEYDTRCEVCGEHCESR